MAASEGTMRPKKQETADRAICSAHGLPNSSGAIKRELKRRSAIEPVTGH